MLSPLDATLSVSGPNSSWFPATHLCFRGGGTHAVKVSVPLSLLVSIDMVAIGE